LLITLLTIRYSATKAKLLDERLQRVIEEKQKADAEAHRLSDAADALTARVRELSESGTEDKALVATLQSALSKSGDESKLEVESLKAALLAATNDKTSLLKTLSALQTEAKKIPLLEVRLLANRFLYSLMGTRHSLF
jgi:hypothetical protein